MSVNIREMADIIGENEGHEIALLDPPEEFDDGAIGFCDNGSGSVVVYSWDRLVKSLAKAWKDGEHTKDDPELAAVEWLEYNTLRSLPYMGPYAPIIIHELKEYE